MKTINISEETYEKIKEQLQEEERIDVNSYDDFIGKKMFFRTVTYHCLGKVIKIIGSFFQLETASWIPDDGRFMQFIKEGKLNEVEPVGTMFINITTVVDMFLWKHSLPTKQQ